jgi:PAS domain S-box-containing protein
VLAGIFLAAAIFFQVWAAVLALSLIRVTGRSLAWILISAALCLMAVRRIIPFVGALSWQSISPDPTYELIGMLLSAFMAAGVALIKPIFKKVFESERALAESERRYRGYFELPIVGFATVTEDGRWITVNDRLCEMVGAERGELVGASVDDSTAAEDRGVESRLAAEALSGASEGYIIDKRMARGRTGDCVWVSQAARHVPGKDGVPGYFVLIIQDISERKAYESRLSGSLAEKEALLRELYHRTKNNMQVICSLLNLECSRCKDPSIAEEFHTIEGRIQSMSLVHEKLYRSRDLSRIDLAEYIGDLVELLTNSYGVRPERIRVSESLSPIRVPIDIAVPCGLILHEVISNSLKHAFPNERSGRLDIRLDSTEDGRVRIVVSDDGIGMAKDFDSRTCEGMGIRTIVSLAEQISGTIAFSGACGVSCELRFPSPAVNATETSGPGARVASAFGVPDVASPSIDPD